MNVNPRTNPKMPDGLPPIQAPPQKKEDTIPLEERINALLEKPLKQFTTQPQPSS